MSRKRKRVQEDPMEVPSMARVRIEYRDINDVTPYDQNPRDNSDAIQSVANSINAFGFLVPVVVDSDGVIAAGHTRYEAAKLLGLIDLPVVQADHLTEEQIDQFRIIDNKVSELARWDMNILSDEISRLADSGVEFKDFGFTEGELDCLTDMVNEDCLGVGSEVAGERSTGGRATPRAPSQARFVLSEFVFFAPIDAYKRWAAEIRNSSDYKEEDIIKELQDRLGITPYIEAEE